MSDEPIYTGALPMQLSGDLALAKSYEREGRRLLGTLLNVHGVNERIGAGEPGGFYKSTRELPDGSRLTAITNDGRHLVRIDTPRPLPTHEGSSHSERASGSAPHVTFTPTFENNSETPTPPLPTLPYREIGDEEEEEKKDTTDYMWVGIRSTNPDVPWYAMQAVMVEPDSGPVWDGDGHKLRGIVASMAEWQTSVRLEQNDDGTYTVSDRYPLTNSKDVPSAVRDLYDLYHPTGGAQENLIPGTHCISATIEIPSDLGFDGMIDEAEFLCSANGLRCFMNAGASQVAPDPARWNPFDPQADDQTGAGVRNYGDRKIRSSYPISPCLWDIVYVCDPDEAQQLYPVETRPHVLAARVALEQAGMRNTLLPGEYLLGLHVVDDAPGLRSTRASEVIPMYAGDTFGYRSASSDYDEYMKPIDTTLNTQVEIEVRLGRGADAATMQFATTVASADDRDFTYYPYGYGYFDECSQYGGANPLGPNWAPQFLAINAMGGSARWVDPDIAPIFGGGTYLNPDDRRRPFDIYFNVYGPSQPDQADFAEYMANALYAVLEAASAGVYGEVFMHDPGSEGALRARLAGLSKSQIWRFDPMTGSIGAVPLISEVDDYPYGSQTDADGNTFQSPYVEPMFWYYPYKVLSKNACRNSVGICITAVKGTYFFEVGQVVYYQDPPPNPDCC